MAELERELRALELDWPATPPAHVALSPRRPARRKQLLIALVVLVLAVAVAFAVPSARSAILRVFHLGGATVERVTTLPSAETRPLDASLGPVANAAAVRTALGGPMHLPPGAGSPPVHLQGSIASVVLELPQPVLLSELLSDAFLLKKVGATATRIVWLTVDGSPGIWLTGARHVVIFPDAPARLAGNVLLWTRGGRTYRLEAPNLTRADALALAKQIDGT